MTILAYLAFTAALASGPAGEAAAPSATADSTAAQAPASEFESVGFRYLSWGATVHAWTMDPAGAVVWEAPPEPVFHSNGQPITIDIKRFVLTPEQRSAIHAKVRAAQAAQALPDECDEYVPDGPYARVTWTIAGKESAIMVTASCLKGPNAEKAGPAFSLDRIVREVADKAPVVDHRQE